MGTDVANADVKGGRMGEWLETSLLKGRKKGFLQLESRQKAMLGDEGEKGMRNRLDTVKGAACLLDEIGEFFVLCSSIVQLLPAGAKVC